jgi:hypothetical protein
MAGIFGSVSIAANAVNENVLTGSQFEILDMNALVEFGLVQSATGLVLDVFSGRDIVAESYSPVIKATAPVYPDDYPLNDVAALSDRLKIRARNTTGGALTLFFSVKFTPV